MAVETSVFGIVLLLAFGLWIGLGLLAAYVANEKGRGGGAWFIVGMLFGPIAFLALIAIPARDQAAADSRASGTLPSAPGALQPVTKVCPRCGETVRASAETCRFCGFDLRSPSPSSEAVVPAAEANPVAVAVDTSAALGRWTVRRSAVLAIPPGTVVEVTADGGALIVSSAQGKLRSFRAGEVQCAREPSGSLQIRDTSDVILWVDPLP